MRYTAIPSSFFLNNRNKFTSKLSEHSIAFICSNDDYPRNGDQNFIFRQDSDYFYLTGLEQKDGILVISNLPNCENEQLFIRKPTPLAETWEGHKYTCEEATAISSIKKVSYLEDFEKFFYSTVIQTSNILINTKEELIPATKNLQKKLLSTEKLKSNFSGKTILSINPIIAELRLIKEPIEIELIKKACKITEDAFHRVLKTIRSEMKEYEVEAEITYEFMRQGASGHAYSPIVASGKSACTLHYNENDKVCKNGDLVLLDFGAEYGNYAADLTRTIPVNGKFTQRQKDCYNAVLRVMKQATQLLLPGTSIDENNKKVGLLMEEEMIGLGLFTREDVEKQDKEHPMYFKYYMHGASHFMGLDVHDVGTKQHILQKGMVLSCEPGIYIQEENIGIRIENDILIDDQPIDLMASIPREVEEIEALMR